jgi:hypothetical protein
MLHADKMAPVYSVALINHRAIRCNWILIYVTDYVSWLQVTKCRRILENTRDENTIRFIRHMQPTSQHWIVSLLPKDSEIWDARLNAGPELFKHISYHDYGDNVAGFLEASIVLEHYPDELSSGKHRTTTVP